MRRAGFGTMAPLFVSGPFLAGCGQSKGDPKAEAPPPVKVESEQDLNVFQVDHPEQFLLATATAHDSASQLTVTGIVTPDITRSVPVISIATGRVVELHARLGDTVNKAQVDVENTTERLRVLGGSIDHPAAILDIRAPVSGVITDQQVTNAAGVAGLGSPNPFTISDLSYVWILCDVYENDLASVHIGESAEIRLNAYPDKVFTGRISNLLPVLDPTLRTAKVRIEVRNPGLMRVGMFVTATFHGQKKVTHALVPATAILHLHDRNWVYVPAGDKKFRRVEVVDGQTLPGSMQEVISGIKPGVQVVQNALVFQNTVEQ